VVHVSIEDSASAESDSDKAGTDYQQNDVNKSVSLFALHG
jgi:hypothetical protein